MRLEFVVGRPWTADLPVVTVQSGAPKRLTLIYPYYDNPSFLRRQISGWHDYSADIKAHLSVIIVDDGSPLPAAQVLRGMSQPFPFRLFRIGVDVRWNWLAARNLAFSKAPEGWCLVTDMDHIIPESTARAAVYGQHDPAVIYGFRRLESTGESIGSHPNSWLMTRAMFWAVGGYDERLSGHYGTDGDWRRRCAKTAPMAILWEPMIRHEHVGDSSTERYLRKQPEDAAVSRIIAQRKPGWRPKTLSFPYEEVDLVGVEVACRR